MVVRPWRRRLAATAAVGVRSRSQGPRPTRHCVVSTPFFVCIVSARSRVRRCQRTYVFRASVPLLFPFPFTSALRLAYAGLPLSFVARAWVPLLVRVFVRASSLAFIARLIPMRASAVCARRASLHHIVLHLGTRIRGLAVRVWGSRLDSGDWRLVVGGRWSLFWASPPPPLT